MNKLYENELMFERANAEMSKLTASLTPSDFPEDFVLSLYCECANKACYERINIAFGEYTQFKQEAAFVVRAEHYLPEFEHLLKKKPDYWVITKRPDRLDKPFEV